MSDDPLGREKLPRQPGGQFTKGSGFTSETAKAARAIQRSMGKSEAKNRVEQLLEEAGFEEDAPETIRLLAEKAVRGSQADMRLFLQQTNQIQSPQDKWDGQGPCPTCGQVPGEGLVLAGRQFDSVDHAVQELDRLLTASELLVQREKVFDEKVAP